jgi:hypothetical protein
VSFKNQTKKWTKKKTKKHESRIFGNKGKVPFVGSKQKVKSQIFLCLWRKRVNPKKKNSKLPLRKLSVVCCSGGKRGTNLLKFLCVLPKKFLTVQTCFLNNRKLSVGLFKVKRNCKTRFNFCLFLRNQKKTCFFYANKAFSLLFCNNCFTLQIQNFCLFFCCHR